jgi:hypothetical protein
VNVDPQTFVIYVAIPIILTIVYGLPFLFGGFKNLRSRLLAVAVLLIFIWFYPHLRRNDFRSEPPSPKPIGVRVAVVVAVEVGVGLLIYLLGDW